jgi:hypothetical protein
MIRPGTTVPDRVLALELASFRCPEGANHAQYASSETASGYVVYGGRYPGKRLKRDMGLQFPRK